MISSTECHARLAGLTIGLSLVAQVFAHDPVFSPGPHVLFKGGVELHAELGRAEKGDASESEQTLALKYGMTGDWLVGVALPYRTHRDVFGRNSGVGDLLVSTKYRFWRQDTLAVQKSVAILIKLKLDSSNSTVSTDASDLLLGLTYGYESLKWYRWASARYRFNQNTAGGRRDDRVFIDLAGGYRRQLNGYREPDTVWMLELNGEYAPASTLNGLDIDHSGGSQWFVSPGVMWTLRNFAIKAGVQIPLYSTLDGHQSSTDYRARVELEWHL